MARSTTMRDLADRLIPGGLATYLTERKVDQRLSFRAIARHLEDDHDIVVTDETVRAWCIEYGVPTGRQPAEVAS